MIQGGDPTGTGRGGKSYFGAPFEDEFHEKMLTHSQRGTLSMANRGRNTNTSQFFTAFKALPHLNHKHTVFGKLREGYSTLDQIEQIKTNESVPSEDISIIKTVVHNNPYRKTIAEILAKDWKILHSSRKKELVVRALRE